MDCDCLDLTINIINLSFSILNLTFSIILEALKSSFNSATTTTLVRYNYFEEVLLNPYFKLIMTSFSYDILFYTSKYLLTKYFFNLSKEKNEESIRKKSIRENLISNLLVEFLFMTMIKGLALGFGIFYVFKLDEEIKRIIKIREINNKQENALNSMISILIINGTFNFLTLFYQLLFFGIRIFRAIKGNKKKNFQESSIINHKKMEKVNSKGNISLSEKRDEEVSYEKLDQ